MVARYREGIIAIFIFLVAQSNSIACAGDAAARQIIGFSPDGRYFAFEQYGVQDGSGFAYSEIMVIDASSDALAEGTPVRKRADDEKVSLEAIRQREG